MGSGVCCNGGGRMPCESCGVQFSVFRRKRPCAECERLYCAACLRRGGGMCAPCRALSTKPLQRHTIAHLKVKDLQCFLQRQNVSTRGCVEKEELITLCVQHVNSAAYKRRGRPGGGTGTGGNDDSCGSGSTSTFLKGCSRTFNELFDAAFEYRAFPVPARGPPRTCFNAAHPHAPAPTTAPPAPQPPAPQPTRERFTTRPGGEPDIEVPVPDGLNTSRSGESLGANRVDTADCFEIEDLDDAGWEFVTRPADPLPNDSEILLAENAARCPASDDSCCAATAAAESSRCATTPQATPTVARQRPAPPPAPPAAASAPPASAPPASAPPASAPRTPQRASSELELRDAAVSPDATSLQDEPMMDGEQPGDEQESPQSMSLSSFSSAAELERLSVKQLKELLTRNRVEYRYCLERNELLDRAQRLWTEHDKYAKDAETDKLPMEECCKICMAAPLECVLLECGHIAACTRCAKQLAECPICRQYVVRAVRFFRS